MRPPAQAMLAMSDTGALLRFVQRPNRAAIGESEGALRAAGRYSELVALLQARGRHQAALDLLRALALVRAPRAAHAVLSAGVPHSAAAQGWLWTLC